jgi:hypothetical protein
MTTRSLVAFVIGAPSRRHHSGKGGDRWQYHRFQAASAAHDANIRSECFAVREVKHPPMRVGDACAS